MQASSTQARSGAKQSLFTRVNSYPCTVEQLFAWHSRPGALERLLPPWEKLQVRHSDASIVPGSRVELAIGLGPFRLTYRALHTKETPPSMFQDIQEQGPFASWTHTHLLSPHGRGALLEDRIEYQLPGHTLLPRFFHRQVAHRLACNFAHRHRTLEADIKLHLRCSHHPLRILVTGASGVLGKELLPLLSTGGHQVFTLVRRPPARATEIQWDPERGQLAAASLPELDAVIHLAGKYIGLGRWDERRKQQVIHSRVAGTELLASTLAKMPNPPKVLLSASAVGYYGDCGDRLVDEEAAAGNSFMSEVCRKWEAATHPAEKAGIRVVHMRLGVGLTPRGGGLQRILAASPCGFIRRFGDGRQYMSWMSTDDMVSAMLHCLAHPELSGPVNIAAPLPVTNEEFMATLAEVTGRPLLVAVPAKLLTTLYGQMAEEIVLSGCRVSCRKLVESGFIFRHPDLKTTFSHLLGKTCL